MKCYKVELVIVQDSSFFLQYSSILLTHFQQLIRTIQFIFRKSSFYDTVHYFLLLFLFICTFFSIHTTLFTKLFLIYWDLPIWMKINACLQLLTQQFESYEPSEKVSHDTTTTTVEAACKFLLMFCWNWMKDLSVVFVQWRGFIDVVNMLLF